MIEQITTFFNLVLLLYKRSAATLLQRLRISQLLNGQLISQSHEGLQVWRGGDSWLEVRAQKKGHLREFERGCLLVPVGPIWVVHKLLMYWDFHPQPAPVSSSCPEERSCWCEASGQDAIMLLLLNSYGYFKVGQLPIKMKTISLQVPGGALSVSFRWSLLGILFYYHSLKVAHAEKGWENRDSEWNLLD